MHKHHIVFRSQGGLNFPLNLETMTYEEHEGPDGPHRSRERDMELKRILQHRLELLFSGEGYTTADIAHQLCVSPKYIEKNFRKVPAAAGLYKPEDIIRKLMGGRLYE